MQESRLARIFHDLLSATAEMAFLPGVLLSRTLQGTVQLRLWFARVLVIALLHVHLHGFVAPNHEIARPGKG